MAVLTFVRHKFWDDAGLPLSGGKVYIYEPGTTTAKQSFTDSTGLVPNTNPVILDSKGEAGIWTVGMFKINITSSTDVQITGYPVDNCGYDITSQSYATAIHGATLKSVPAVLDEAGIWDSVSGLLNKTTLGAIRNMEQPLNATSINGGQISGFRNKIINGDMQVSQINGLTAVTPAATGYPIDQWQCGLSVASKLTFQQVADAPSGFKYSTKISVGTQYAPLATDVFVFQQPIEGQNIADLQIGSATPATIATGQYVKGSVPGNYAVSIRNLAGTRSYVGIIPVTLSWAKAVITLVGDNAGTWASDNTAGLIYSFDLGSGSNFNATSGAWTAGSFTRTSGAVTFVNQVAGSTLNITGVQLEKITAGTSSATEYEHVSYADQLRWCQRYLPVFTGTALLPTGCYTASTTTTAFSLPLPVSTRVPITGLILVGTASYNNATNVYAISSVTIGGASSNSVSFTSTNAATVSANLPGMFYLNSANSMLYGTGAQM